MTKTIETSVDVAAPPRQAYDQWTQFELFPTFMEGVDDVRQQDDRTLRWQAVVNGVRRQWLAEIVEQIPDQRIAWRCTEGARHAGVVTFHRLGDDKCRVMVQIDYEPRGLLEHAGAWLGVPGRQVKDDLQRFARFLEARDEPTGAWRGRIDNPGERAGSSP